MSRRPHFQHIVCQKVYEGLSGKLVTTILKPGRRSKNVDVFAILKRVISYLRQHWKNTIIILRGDSHFCSHQYMDWSVEWPNIHFVTGLSGNKKLNELAKITIESAQRAFEANGTNQKRYSSFMYQAQSWEHPQRVIVKVEVYMKLEFKSFVRNKDYLLCQPSFRTKRDGIIAYEFSDSNAFTIQRIKQRYKKSLFFTRSSLILCVYFNNLILQLRI